MNAPDYLFDHASSSWTDRNGLGKTPNQAPANAILLVNLGSPDAPEPGAVRRYLKEFLWDRRVVEIPRVLWWLILNGIILRFRPKKTAAKYETVWQNQGAPLVNITREQTVALRALFNTQFSENQSDPVIIEFAMRYGNPSVEAVITDLMNRNVRRLLVVPLYPQYSATTTASVFDAVSNALQKQRWLPELRFLTHYHDFPAYIDACADQITRYQAEHGVPQKLVLSYHGIPQRYFRKGDPYHCECLKTSRLIREKLNLSSDQLITTFQSRFGRDPWLQPYTDKTLEQLGRDGIEHIQVFCPGFAADCLETLEEIDEENREIFIEAGGKRFGYIPALNAQPAHIRALGQLTQSAMQGWSSPLVSPENPYDQWLKEQQ